MASYIASVKDGFNAAAAIKEIDALAKQENATVSYTTVFDAFGVIVLDCEKATADKIRNLKTIKTIEPDRPAFAS